MRPEISPSTRNGRLPALDGLRTVAVALVILFHLRTPGLDAGFLGVDLFFVLSGFLITQGLLRQMMADGIRPFAFWARRMRRLLPAALLVISVTTVVAWFITPLFQRKDLSVDALAATFWWANWRFVDQASYFAFDGTLHPLEHFWSLSLEEQFYLGWPLLLMLIAAATPRKHRLKAVVATTVGLSLVSFSLLMGLYQPTAPNRAYMGTDAKIFEPLLGALLAVAWRGDDFRALVGRWATPVASVGALVMLASAIVSYGAGPHYFGVGALAWSVGSAACIAAVATEQGLVSRFFDLPVLSYLGRISYGLYLWHWPFTLWIMPDRVFDIPRALAVLACTIATSALSFHFFEEPIRRGPIGRWLGTWRTFPVMALAALLSAGLAVSLGRVHTPSEQRVMMVVGDSVPQGIIANMERSASQHNLTVAKATMGGCSPLGNVQVLAWRADNGHICAEERAKQQTALEEYSPSIVLWWSRYEVLDRMVDGKMMSPDDPGFMAAQLSAMDEAVERLTRKGARLVVVETDAPGKGLLARCAPGKQCPRMLELMVRRDDFRKQWIAELHKRYAHDERVRFIKIQDLYCPADAAAGCNDVDAQGRVWRPDGTHFDEAHAQVVADELLRRVVKVVS